MSIWALSDPHLAFGVPAKTMEDFGPAWSQYADRISTNWKKKVSPDDLVLIPGDISWAMRLDEALIDLQWIDALPGTKVILRGNHDYWWPSASKLTKALPPSILFIQNNALLWNGIAIGGSRLWDTPEYGFEAFIDFHQNPKAKTDTREEFNKEKEEEERIFLRELERLKLSLSQMDKNGQIRIAMTHYPPIGADLLPSRASQILEEFQVDICVFGHLHNVKPGALPFGKTRGVQYLLASCDYLQFNPLKVI
jgi:predicted phosphohydrolase